MIIAVASGKGGTGKTTVTASLASIWPGGTTAVDLDVEEPNLHLFLNPEITGRDKALIEVPQADESKCTHCRACAEICQFKAVNVLGDYLLLYTDMCHGCGGCLAVCPENVFTPAWRTLGEVSWGKASVDGQGGIDLLMGRLRVGEALSPPLIRRVRGRLEKMPDRGDVIIDAPPGASCPAMNAVAGADVLVMVTEPTPFGLHDLKLALAAFDSPGRPMGVVINRAGLGDDCVADYCAERDLPVLARIPYDRRAAEAYSHGRILALENGEYRRLFTDLVQGIRGLMKEVDHV